MTRIKHLTNMDDTTHDYTSSPAKGASAVECTKTKNTTAKAASEQMHRKQRIIRGTRWQFSAAQLLWILELLTVLASLTTIQATVATTTKEQQQDGGSGTIAPSGARTKYSQLLTPDGDNDSFRPIIPSDINREYMSRNVFTPAGQYRVFQPDESDLRAALAMSNKGHVGEEAHVLEQTTTEGSVVQQDATSEALTTEQALSQYITTTAPASKAREHTSRGQGGRKTETPAGRRYEQQQRPTKPTAALGNEMKELEELLVEYVENFFNKGQYEPTTGLVYELQKNRTSTLGVPVKSDNSSNNGYGRTKQRYVRRAVGASRKGGSVNVNIPRAVESGRLFFFAGLKKIMWPIFMGLQILKSLLFAMFLPTLIGSFSKLLGKGIVSGSAPLFIRPAEAPQELDFRDNNFNFEDDNKFATTDDVGTKDDAAYAYNQPEASQNHYVYDANSLNQQVLSRYGNEQQKMPDSYLSALQSISSGSFKNSNSLSGSSSAGGLGGGAPARQKPASPANMNTFQTFQKVPASSLLLSNYDPFYSPLLSRLDSVFAQLKLNSENEICREKLICLMYANPAKYAPYSNLVSAQLSRELNELRKPTSDNPDILRFFKYMRAAKDGQDGVDCEKTFDRCKEFKDFENPAMVSTYHDINKLVQARKLT